jgi:hypothetical protein
MTNIIWSNIGIKICVALGCSGSEFPGVSNVGLLDDHKKDIPERPHDLASSVSLS